MDWLRSFVPVLMLLMVAATSLADDSATGQQKDGSLKTDGVVIPSPAEGYHWEKVGDMQQGDVKATVHLATKQGADAKVVFIAGLALPGEEKERANMVFGFYDGIAETMQKAGYADFKPARPRLRPPMPDRVTFFISARTPDGKSVVVAGGVLFGKKSVYQFQVQAASEAEAKDLLKCMDGMKEQP